MRDFLSEYDADREAMLVDASASARPAARSSFSTRGGSPAPSAADLPSSGLNNSTLAAAPSGANPSATALSAAPELGVHEMAIALSIAIVLTFSLLILGRCLLARWLGSMSSAAAATAVAATARMRSARQRLDAALERGGRATRLCEREGSVVEACAVVRAWALARAGSMSGGAASPSLSNRCSLLVCCSRPAAAASDGGRATTCDGDIEALLARAVRLCGAEVGAEVGAGSGAESGALDVAAHEMMALRAAIRASSRDAAAATAISVRGGGGGGGAAWATAVRRIRASSGAAAMGACGSTASYGVRRRLLLRLAASLEAEEGWPPPLCAQLTQLSRRCIAPALAALPEGGAAPSLTRLLALLPPRWGGSAAAVWRPTLEAALLAALRDCPADLLGDCAAASPAAGLCDCAAAPPPSTGLLAHVLTVIDDATHAAAAERALLRAAEAVLSSRAAAVAAGALPAEARLEARIAALQQQLAHQAADIATGEEGGESGSEAAAAQSGAAAASTSILPTDEAAAAAAAAAVALTPFFTAEQATARTARRRYEAAVAALALLGDGAELLHGQGGATRTRGEHVLLCAPLLHIVRQLAHIAAIDALQPALESPSLSGVEDGWRSAARLVLPLEGAAAGAAAECEPLLLVAPLSVDDASAPGELRADGSGSKRELQLSSRQSRGGAAAAATAAASSSLLRASSFSGSASETLAMLSPDMHLRIALASAKNAAAWERARFAEEGENRRHREALLSDASLNAEQLSQQRNLQEAALSASAEQLRAAVTADFVSANLSEARVRASERLRQYEGAAARARATRRAAARLRWFLAAAAVALVVIASLWQAVTRHLWLAFPLACPAEACAGPLSGSEARAEALARESSPTRPWWLPLPLLQDAALMLWRPTQTALAALAAPALRLLPCLCWQPLRSFFFLLASAGLVVAARWLAGTTGSSAALTALASLALGPPLLERGAALLPRALLLAAAAAALATAQQLAPKCCAAAADRAPPSLEALQREEQRALDAASRAARAHAGVLPPSAAAGIDAAGSADAARACDRDASRAGSARLAWRRLVAAANLVHAAAYLAAGYAGGVFVAHERPWVAVSAHGEACADVVRALAHAALGPAS